VNDHKGIIEEIKKTRKYVAIIETVFVLVLAIINLLLYFYFS